MDLDIRAVSGEDELVDFIRCAHAAFGGEMKDDSVERVTAMLELDRTRAAFEDGRIVGTSGAFSWEVTVPGGATLPASGVTWVAVRPTHRRRGILRSMMAALLDDAVDRGEPLAMLIASESVIYGRFGYGPATYSGVYEIERPHARLARPAPPPGRLVFLEPDDAEPVMRAVFEEYRRTSPGEVSRSDAWWQSFFADRADERGGASRRYYVAHEREPGVWDGYAAYRVHEKWDGGPDYTLEADAVVALSADTRLALLAYLFDVDLVSRIKLMWHPVDEPVRWALTDPRRLHTTGVHDVLWVRPLDVERALAARTYSTAGRVVLEVDDLFRPDAGGRFALEGGPDGASCERTSLAPDVVLGPGELGALYLGGTSARALADVGRVVERADGAVATLGAMFRTDPAPYCDTDF